MSITVFLSQKLEKKKVSTITLHITHGFTIFTVVVKKKARKGFRPPSAMCDEGN